MSDRGAPAFEAASGWQADDATNNFTSSKTPLDDAFQTSLDTNTSHDVLSSDVLNTSSKLVSNEVEDVSARDMFLLQLALFTEEYEPNDTEFSQVVNERSFLYDPYKLIAVKAKDSEEAKEFNGTQWKNSHFLVHVKGSKGKSEQRYLPFSRIHKETGVNMRTRVCGGKLGRKIVMEFTVQRDSNLVHRAYLEIHAHTHVTSYEYMGRTVKESRINRRGRQHEPDEDIVQDSYILVRLVTTAGIGIGLDFDADFLDEEDRQVLRYARHLSTNSSRDTSMKRVIVRLNARYIEYEMKNPRTKRKGEEQERFHRQFETFMEDTRAILAPYRDLRGNPICHWAQFITRQIIADEANGLVPIPAHISFATLAEMQITFTYGAFLEWKREAQIAQSVSCRQHPVSFLVVKPSTILAFVKLNMPEDLGIEQWVPRENTVVEIGFQPPHKISLGDIKCTGIIIPDIFNLPYQNGCLFLIPTAKVRFYSSFAVNVGQRPRFLPTKLTISIPQSGAQRQVDSMNRLCTPGPHLEALSNVSLNREAGLRPLVNPFSGLGIPSSTVQTAINEVLQSNVKWSESQIVCIKSIESLPNGILMIQGYPGTGKTFTLVAIASILISLGMHVVFTAPSHYAADAICNQMDKWAERTGVNLNPVRVYRPASEVRAFRVHGIPAAHAGDENTMKVDSEELTVGEATHGVANEDFTPTCIPLENQIHMPEILSEIKDESMKRHYGIAAKSLEYHIFRLAYTEGQQIIDWVPSEKQLERWKGDLFDSIEDGDLDPKGEEADMLQFLRYYAGLIEEQTFRQLDEVTRRKAILAFKKACKQVICEASVIVSTNNNMGDPMIASNFGDTAEGIFVIRDEDPKELEPNGWIPITKLRAGPKIKGIISCGDKEQRRPMVLSFQSSGRYNEFAQQLAVPFSKRLITMHHPVQRLTEQFRFRPCFLSWLNHRTYDGEMTSHPSTANIIVKPQFLEAMQKILDLGHPGNLDLGHIEVSINGSTCEKEIGTNSRFNDQNRLWVLKFLLENLRSVGYNGDDIAIITPYMAQVIRYRQSLIALTQKGVLLRSNFPKVATTDSMQGKEAKVVIYDWVVTSASDMGFTIDDHRGNVEMSRMSEVMVNILHCSIGSDAKSSSRAPRQNYLGGRINTEVPYPCAFIQWQSSQGNIVTVDCPHEDDVFPVVHQ